MNGLNCAHLIRGQRGFTLLEVMAAVAMSAVILGSLYLVLSSAVRMRETDARVLRHGPHNSQALAILRRDLVNAVAPGGVLAGALIGESNSAGDRREDTLEIYTSTGALRDAAPWGDLQKVVYALEEAADDADAGGRTLLRTVTRNLLAATLDSDAGDDALGGTVDAAVGGAVDDELSAVETLGLLDGVESLAFAYYDGSVWLDDWEGTTQESPMPVLIRVRIDFAAPPDGEPARLPLEAVAAVTAGQTGVSGLISAGTPTPPSGRGT